MKWLSIMLTVFCISQIATAQPLDSLRAWSLEVNILAESGRYGQAADLMLEIIELYKQTPGGNLHELFEFRAGYIYLAYKAYSRKGGIYNTDKAFDQIMQIPPDQRNRDSLKQWDPWAGVIIEMAHMLSRQTESMTISYEQSLIPRFKSELANRCSLWVESVGEEVEEDILRPVMRILSRLVIFGLAEHVTGERYEIATDYIRGILNTTLNGLPLFKPTMLERVDYQWGMWLKYLNMFGGKHPKYSLLMIASTFNPTGEITIDPIGKEKFLAKAMISINEYRSDHVRDMESERAEMETALSYIDNLLACESTRTAFLDTSYVHINSLLQNVNTSYYNRQILTDTLYADFVTRLCHLALRSARDLVGGEETVLKYIDSTGVKTSVQDEEYNINLRKARYNLSIVLSYFPNNVDAKVLDIYYKTLLLSDGDVEGYYHASLNFGDITEELLPYTTRLNNFYRPKWE